MAVWHKSGLGTQVGFHGFQGMLFQPAHLSLGNTDFTGHFHLGFSSIETHFYNFSFSFAQSFQGLLQR